VGRVDHLDYPGGRLRAARFGLVTMCIGVGQGIAMVVEKGGG